MGKIKQSFQLVWKNFPAIIIFETLLKLASFVLFLPGFQLLFSLFLKFRGVRSVSTQNALTVLAHPLAVLLLLAFLVIRAAWTLLELSGLIVALDRSYHNQKVTATELFLQGGRSIKKLLRSSNWLLFLFLFLLLPISQIYLSSNYLQVFEIPQFITDYIQSQATLHLLYGLFLLLASFLVFQWLFSLHFYVLEDKGFSVSRKESVQLMKGRRIKDLLRLVGWELLLLFLAFVLFFLFISTFVFLIHFFSSNRWLILILAALATTGINFIHHCVLVPLGISYVSALFYEEKQRNELPVVEAEPQQKNPVSRPYWMFILALSLAANLIYLSYNTRENVFGQFDFTDTVEVTAHRGASMEAPENSRAAFEKAIESGAQWIELDVQQLSDGTLIIMHDSNFKRIGGLNQSVWKTTYSEVEHLDIGSWFDPSFQDLRLMTLDDVLTLTKGKIKLNIEIKPTGHEKEIGRQVAETIEAHGMEKECVISSFNYNILEDVKAHNPEIKTFYILAVHYGKGEEFPAADGYSIEATALSSSFVSYAKRQEKEIFVWTVNDPEEMKRFADMGVNNLITNDPITALQVVNDLNLENPLRGYSTYLSALLDKMIGSGNFSISI